MSLANFKTIVTKTMPVMAGYIVLGIGFGLLLQVNGYGLVWALLMSVFIYAGSLQYVGTSLLAGSVSFVSIALTSLIINARHLFYGISMLEEYKGSGAKKPYLIHALTDETYSLVCTKEVPDGFEKHTYYFLISIFNQFYWVLGSVIGSLLGAVIPWDMSGLEFSMTALFVTVFVEQWIKEKQHLPAIIGLVCSIICLIIFGSQRFLVPDMIAIIIVMSIFRKSISKEGEE